MYFLIVSYDDFYLKINFLKKHSRYGERRETAEWFHVYRRQLI
jgi:hypothetical protein